MRPFWTDTLPAETAIAAVVGAVLSTVLAQNNVFSIEHWYDSWPAIYLISLVLGFGVMIHFFCIAVVRKLPSVYLPSAMIAIGALFCIVFLNRADWRFPETGEIIFLPYAYNILLAGVMLIWYLSVQLTTLIASDARASNGR